MPINRQRRIVFHKGKVIQNSRRGSVVNEINRAKAQLRSTLSRHSNISELMHFLENMIFISTIAFSHACLGITVEGCHER